MSFIGEISALFTALFWAVSVIYFRQLGGLFSPVQLNLWKGLISVLGLGLIIGFQTQSLPHYESVLWLLLSGLIGIGIGDTAFFSALNRLGETSTLLLAETLAPIFYCVAWLFSGFQNGCLLSNG